MKRNQICVNALVSNYKVRQETLEGKQYMVAPVVLLVEGVHCGLDGVPTYYPEKEISKFPASWNGIPLPFHHPEVEGNAISANSPQMIEQCLGRLWNVVYEDSKLKGEIWIDIEKTRSTHPEIVGILTSGGNLEVSTGLWADEILSVGVWNDETYERVLSNFRPDHLALLPDSEGACNYDDGCGVRANKSNMKGGESMKFKGLDMSNYKVKDGKVFSETGEVLNGLPIVARFYFNEALSHNEIRRGIQNVVDSMDSSIYMHYVVDIFDDYFVYEAMPQMQGRPSKLYKQAYTANESGEVTVAETVEEVRRLITYEPKQKTNEGGEKMEKKICCPERVKALIANEKTKFKESDKDWLESLSEKALAEVEEMEAANRQGVSDLAVLQAAADAGAAELKALKDGKPEPKVEPKAEPKTAEDFIATAPAEMKEVLTDGLSLYRDRKNKLVAVLFANKKNKFTEVQLKAKSVDELEAIAALASTPEASYVGNEGVHESTGEEAMEMPVMDFSKK